MAWYCMEGNTVGGRGYLSLGEATQWYMAEGVLWSVGWATSRHLLKWDSFRFCYRQGIAVENPSPTSTNEIGAPPPLDPRDPPSRSWWWKQWHWDPHQWSASLCYFLFLVLTQDQKMHLIRVCLVRPPMTVWIDTSLCYEWGCYEIHTTSPFPSLDLWCFSKLHCFGLASCSSVRGHLSDLQIQCLASSA